MVYLCDTYGFRKAIDCIGGGGIVVVFGAEKEEQKGWVVYMLVVDRIEVLVEKEQRSQ